MVSIVSCLIGTALRGRIGRKTFVGILQLIVLVSLSTKQTDAETAAACYDGEFICDYGQEFCCPPRCGGGSTVDVIRVEIGTGTCKRTFCCPGSPWCEVSAEEVQLEFCQSVVAACHGRQGCDGLRTPSNWTSLVDYCEETHDYDGDDDESGQIVAKYVKIEYNCKRGEASGRGSASDQVGVAVGVTVAVLVVVGVITAVLVIYFLRRRRKQMERQTGTDAVASQATPVPNSYDNAFYQEVIPPAPPPTPGGTTRDPPPRDPTASSGNPHTCSPGAAQDTDYDLVRSPYAKVQRRTSQDSEYDLRLMENPTYN